MSDGSSEANRAVPEQPEPSRRQWGVLVATLWLIVAFYGAQYLALATIPYIQNLPLSIDAKGFLVQAFADLVLAAIIGSALYFYQATPESIGYKAFKPIYLGLVFVCLPLYAMVSQFFIELVSRIDPAFNPNARQTILFKAGSLPEMILVFIALVVIPPLVEEMIFRGFLLKAYQSRFGAVTGSVLVSVLFALAHSPAVVSVDVFALSLFLCYLRIKSDSLWPSILLHALKNLVAFITLFIIMPR